MQLKSLQHGDSSIIDYVLSIETGTNNLSIITDLVCEPNLIIHVFASLGLQYDTLSFSHHANSLFIIIYNSKDKWTCFLFFTFSLSSFHFLFPSLSRKLT